MPEQLSSAKMAGVFAQRRAKLERLRAQGWAWPNHFRPTHTCAELPDIYRGAGAGGATPGEAEQAGNSALSVAVAGRLMAKRDMGSVLFFRLRDGSGEIQLYVSKNGLGQAQFAGVRAWDVGDIVGARGDLFRTRTGELSVRCAELILLAKNLRPLPEKFHGLTDVNLRYRHRYLDLLANQSVRDVFVLRSRVISLIRRYLHERDFLEVETPVLQAQPGGATAKPFITHHNALDLELYLRVSPELYLKRLLVGGFDRVYELGRNFRNEGLSTRHNPEFTMLEFYESYQDYRGMMRHTQDMFAALGAELGCQSLRCGTEEVSLADDFECIRLEEAILRYHPKLSPQALRDAGRLAAYSARILPESAQAPEPGDAGSLLMRLFEATVEQQLIRPTFVTHHPASVSALARPSDDDPFVCDRFELIINGQEICNGFSENNDPCRQRRVFAEQLNDHRLAEQLSLRMDEDFLAALETGMPPAAGQGIGIDRLVLQLARSASIRDVIFFPLTRPES